MRALVVVALAGCGRLHFDVGDGGQFANLPDSNLVVPAMPQKLGRGTSPAIASGGGPYAIAYNVSGAIDVARVDVDGNLLGVTMVPLSQGGQPTIAARSSRSRGMTSGAASTRCTASPSTPAASSVPRS